MEEAQYQGGVHGNDERVSIVNVGFGIRCLYDVLPYLQWTPSEVAEGHHVAEALRYRPRCSVCYCLDLTTRVLESSIVPGGEA